LVTDPSAMENWLPWHGQMMFFAETRSTVQPRWVQVLLKPRNEPVLGWVTTMLLLASTTPPPTGTSETRTRAPAGGLEVVGFGVGFGVGLVAPGDVVGFPEVEPPEPPPEPDVALAVG